LEASARGFIIDTEQRKMTKFLSRLRVLLQDCRISSCCHFYSGIVSESPVLPIAPASAGFAILLSLRWEREKAIGGKVARFQHLNADKPNMHHDALEFPDGGTVFVTRLCEGQHATVLQLPASPRSVNAEVGLKHAAVVG
jgi:hypothetical protein